MVYKSLLIVFLVYTCIEINGGMYHGDNDDDDMFSQFNDLSGDPPSPGIKMFGELYGTSEQHTNVETREESSRPTVTTEEIKEKKKAEEIFMQEYHLVLNKTWNELHNNLYNKAWPALCQNLWEIGEAKNKKQEDIVGSCTGKSSSTQKVRISITLEVMKADLLFCECPGTKFFVTKCRLPKYDNYYYIINPKPSAALFVTEMRFHIFDPDIYVDFSNIYQSS